MEKKIQILHLNDDKENFDKVKSILEAGNLECEITMVGNEKDFKEMLKTKHFDLIFSGYNLPVYHGLSALKYVRNSYPHLPFIVISNSIGEEAVVECMLAGASDYISKNNLKRLLSAVKRILEESEVLGKKMETENELAETRKQFISQLENTPLAVIYWDLNFRIQEWNKSAERIFGYSRKEALGKHANEIIVPEEIQKDIEKLFNNIIERKSGKISKNENITKDGRKIWCYWHNTIITDNHNNISKVLSIAEDITEQEKTRKALVDTKNLYHTLFNLSIDAIILHDIQGNILSANEKAVDLLGLKDKDISKLNLKDLHPDYNYVPSKAAFNDILKDGMTNFIIDFKNTNGKIFTAEVNSKLLTINDKKIILGIIRDITDKLEAEKKLKAGEEKYRKFFDEDISADLIVNSKGEIIDCNKIFISLFEFSSKEEALKTNLSELSGNDKDKEKDAKLPVNPSNREDELEQYTRYYITKKGNKIYVLQKVVGIARNNDGLKNYQVYMVDITNIKKMEKELIDAKEKAEEMNRLKSIFLANMSHELRTPLVGILGFTDILKEEIKAPELKNYAKLVFEAGERLLNTFDSILALSMIESHNIKVNRNIIDMVQTVKEIVFNFQSSAIKKNISLNFESKIDNLTTVTNTYALQGIMNKLISNALKFTNEGSVTVKLAKMSDNKHFQITIKDTGIGIEKDKQGIIWEAFRQVSEGNTRKFEGVGLGLSLVKEYVNLLGGSISLESDLGIGSEFTLIFPLILPNAEIEVKRIQADDIKNTKMDSPATGKVKPRVLYFEDDDISIEVAKLYLKQLYDLDFVPNKEEGLTKLSGKKYNLILMDINLKTNVNGVQIMKKIRSMKEYENIPIVSLTAYAMESDKDYYLKEGFDDYISKPYTKKGLLEIIKRNISKYKTKE